MVVLSQKGMLIVNILLLVFGPITVITLSYLLQRNEKVHWNKEGWYRFPLAFVASSGATYGVAAIFATFSPYVSVISSRSIETLTYPKIVYSSSYAVLTSLLCTAYLSMYAVLRGLHLYYLKTSGSDVSQRSVILFQTYLVWWALLVFDTAVLNTKSVGGLYFFTFFHAGNLAAILLVFLEMAASPPATVKPRHSNGYHDDGENGHDDDVVGASEPTERTPLIPPEMDENGSRDSKWIQPLWGLEFLLTAAFPVILTSQLVLVLLTAMPQTLSDGNSAMTIYLLIATLSIVTLLPLAPYIHKVHRTFSILLTGVLVITILYNLLAFPFSQSNPLKIYFQQTMDLDSTANGSNNTVELVAVPGYLEKYIVPSTPSGDDAQRTGTVKCAPAGTRKIGLLSCRFPSLTPNVAPSTTRGSLWSASAAKAELLKVNATRLTAGSGIISIKGENTRSCRVYFDHPIKSISVKGGDDRIQEGYSFPDGGLNEARVWSRTWDRTFEVIVRWTADVEEGEFGGKVSCNWSEMRSERIPALDEQISFIPTWAVVSKLNDGLVEGFKRFEM